MLEETTMAEIYTADTFDLLAFLLENKTKLGILALFLPTMAKFVTQRSWVKLGLLILETARQVAATELEGEDRRAEFKQQIIKIMPWWITKFVSTQTLSDLIDDIYSVILLRPIS
jgi:hypothetical protein